MGGAKSRTLYGKQLEVYYHTPFTEVGEVVDQSTIICHLLRWGRKRVKEEGREEEVSEIFTCLYIHTHGDHSTESPGTHSCILQPHSELKRKIDDWKHDHC